MHFSFMNNLRRATTFVVHRMRRQSTRTGEMPPNVEFRIGRGHHATDPEIRPLLRVLLGGIPGWILIGMAVFGYAAGSDVWTGLFLGIPALLLGFGAVLRDPKRTSSFWILGIDLAGIAAFLFAASAG